MKTSVSLVLAIAVASVFSAAQAQVHPNDPQSFPTLNPGEFSSAIGHMTLGDRMYNHPDVLAYTTTEVRIQSQFSGLLRTAVLDGPEPGVNLDFYYQLHNSGVFASIYPRVNDISLLDFGSSTIQVGQGNTWIIRAVDDPTPAKVNFGEFGSKEFFGVSYASGVVNVTFGRHYDPCCFEPRQGIFDDLFNGDTSHTLVIRTTAQTFGNGILQAPYSYPDNYSGTANFDTFVPTPIPEPSTAALIAAGLGLMGFVTRRRSKQLRR